MTWLWFLNIPLAIMVYFVYTNRYDPVLEEQVVDRTAFEACLADLRDPVIDPVEKADRIRPRCERQKTAFVQKYGNEP